MVYGVRQPPSKAVKSAIKRLVYPESRMVDVPAAINQDLSIEEPGNWPPLYKSVGVMTVAPFHASIGDQSTADVTQSWLSRSGVPAEHTSFWNEGKAQTLIIGGGDIIGAPIGGSWKFVKPRFLPAGRHILNAVGIDPESWSRLPVEMLDGYTYISVRDDEAASFLASRGITAKSVPCPATLQPYLPIDALQSLPRFGALRRIRRHEYAVLHRHPSLIPVARRFRRLGIDVVPIDMQAHARHRWVRYSDVALPPVQSPLVARSLVESASCVITVSLHLAIFALAAQRPLAVLDAGTYQSQKVARYLARAGLSRAMCSDVHQLLDVCELSGDLVKTVGQEEIRAAAKHLEDVARCAHGSLAA